MAIRRLFLPMLFLLIVVQTSGLGKTQISDTSRFNRPLNETLLKQGEKFTLMTCGPCHLGSDGKLSGKKMEDVPRMFGTVFTSNITSDKDVGIGRWTGAQLAYFVKTGVKPNGKRANLAMPRFPNIRDEELIAIVGYLKAGSNYASASRSVVQKSKIGFGGKVATVVASRNYTYTEKNQTSIDTMQRVAYGEYLVDGVLHCFACHSSGMAGVDLLNPKKSNGYLAGGAKLTSPNGEKIISPNLTFDKTSGLGNMSLKQFENIIRSGVKSNGEHLRLPMQSYPTLSENDVAAIYEYLKSLPPVKTRR